MGGPVLSIGIIFKDNIRSIERCLEALTPLRRALRCELVMADTGSVDGSRAVAEKYADVLFDFPWTNDFSAARNSVIDRCSGEWYFSVDTDEYLNPDITQIEGFLTCEERKRVDVCRVLIHDYGNYELEGEYTAFPVDRLFRMDTGIRFINNVHEIFDMSSMKRRCVCTLDETVLKHDGYVGLADARGKEKRRRNLDLLEAEHRERPDDLMLLLQMIESSWSEPEQMDYLRKAAALVEAKEPRWESLGPAVFRYAVRIAVESGLPETEKWIRRAEKWFPDSFYTRIDVEFFAVTYYRSLGKYDECLYRGEKYLLACKGYRSGRAPMMDLSPLSQFSRAREQGMRIFLAELCATITKKPERAVELLDELDYHSLEPDMVERLVAVFRNLQASGGWNLEPLLLRFYDAVCRPEPSEECARKRRATFIRTGSAAFAQGFVQKEAGCADFHRHGYTVFSPLARQCEVGTAAAILECGDRAELEELLGTVERWDELPIAALEHALREGACFPPLNKPLKAEEMNGLVARMARKDGPLAALTIQAGEEDSGKSMQQLAWRSCVALAAVQIYDWMDVEQGLALCLAFSHIQRGLLTRYYAPGVLCKENIHVLPQTHRFSWYCEQAFDALEAGDKPAYVRLLREGVETCPNAKNMVEFLVRSTPELCGPPPSPELLVLAEQVRTMMAAYDPEDPAVQTIKASPVYQKVAYLIEDGTT